MKKGHLHLVSVGPGTIELIPPLARTALEGSELIVGYDLYLKWISPWIHDKEIKALPLTQERERATVAIEEARAGRSVSLVSSGDIGIYAMAGLVFELMDENDTFECEVIPGISAAQSCASLLGAPLTHDYATLSLSDLLCPWEWIEQRARHLAAADMVVALYNVQSQSRQEGVYRILRHFLEHKSSETKCGVVRNAYREDQNVSVCNLGELLERRFDMLTTIIIGNRFTQSKRGFLYTPRGYTGWSQPEPETLEVKSPLEAVWIFSGTSDGNELAKNLQERGYPIIVSTATEYGREAALDLSNQFSIKAGRMGRDQRLVELRQSKARMIVDATHPFANKISRQLIDLAHELNISYIRYERPAEVLPADAIVCDSMEMAAREAVKRGRSIFLSTGSKDLETFLKMPGAEDRSWFVRLTPEQTSLEQALKLGIPRSHICCMQGPFSREFNEAQWRDWSIDCLVTKESGEAGGFKAKIEAAHALKIPILVITRPHVDYPIRVHDFHSIIEFCEEKLGSPVNQPQPALVSL